MGKYPGTYTTQDVCKAEVKECKDILKKYHATPEDTEAIASMIQQAYYMLTESYKTANAMEAYIKDMLGEEGMKDFFAKYISRTRNPGENLSQFLNKLAQEYWEEQCKQEQFNVD